MYFGYPALLIFKALVIYFYSGGKTVSNRQGEFDLGSSYIGGLGKKQNPN